jgi:hypothetical protein
MRRSCHGPLMRQYGFHDDGTRRPISLPTTSDPCSYKLRFASLRALYHPPQSVNTPNLWHCACSLSSTLVHIPKIVFLQRESFLFLRILHPSFNQHKVSGIPIIMLQLFRLIALVSLIAPWGVTSQESDSDDDTPQEQYFGCHRNVDAICTARTEEPHQQNRQ